MRPRLDAVTERDHAAHSAHANHFLYRHDHRFRRVTATAPDCLESDTPTCFPDCRQAFTGTLTAAAIAGSYAEEPNDSCAIPRGGTVNALKQ